MYELAIMGRQIKGTRVIGYILKDLRNGKVELFSKDDTYKLALGRHIKDVVAQNYNGKITMKGINYKISSLPSYDENGKLIQKETKQEENAQKLMLTGRVVDGKATIAYQVALVENGKILKYIILNRDEVMVCAQSGMISNARHQKSNGQDILRGVGCTISELPIVEINSLMAGCNA